MARRDGKGRFLKKTPAPVRVYNIYTGNYGTVIVDKGSLCKVRYDGMPFPVWTWGTRLDFTAGAVTRKPAGYLDGIVER